MTKQMDSASTRTVPWIRRREVRLGGFGLSAIIAVYCGFIGLPVRAAEVAIKSGGYFLMFLTSGMFVASLWKLRGVSVFSNPLRSIERWSAALLIGVLTLIAITAEPYYSKVLNDEFVLQSTAFNMHFYRDVATMVRGYEIGGTFVSLDNYLDKRPYLYPFLVSLLHDFTGYRAQNAFIVNSILFPAGLTLVFAFGRLLRGWSGGMLALVMLGCLPLLAQNATGSGMELTNIVMILAAMCLAAIYLQRPEPNRLIAFLLCIVLLAQARYESALYVAAAVIVVATGWIRSREMDLPWMAALLPWLLLPVALQNKVLSHSPILWELNEQATTRFDIAYFPVSVSGAIKFLFNTSTQHANSIALSVLGLAGLIWAAVAIAGRRNLSAHRMCTPAGASLVAFGTVIIANTLLVFCYYWSRFDDPIAARFSLPVHLLMTFAAVAMLSALKRWIKPMTALVVVGLISFGTASGKFGYHLYSHMGVAEVEWQKRYIDALPPAKRLVVTNQSTIPWLLRKTPSILVGRGRLVADRLGFQLGEPDFDDIIVMQTLRPSTADGDHQVIASDVLPDFFTLELLAEKRFGTRISRISRLVAVNLPANWTPTLTSSTAKSGE